MTIIEPENDHNIKSNNWPNLSSSGLFSIEIQEKKVYFAFIKIDYVRKFQYFQCFDSFFSTNLGLQGSIISFKIIFALMHIKITPS